MCDIRSENWNLLCESIKSFTDMKQLSFRCIFRIKVACRLEYREIEHFSDILYCFNKLEKLILTGLIYINVSK